MNAYPDEVSLEGEALEFVIKHSELIKNLYDNQGNKGALELDADLLFPLDDAKTKQEKWKLFYDVMFPEEGAGKLFAFGKKNISVLPGRGGKDMIKDMLDYLYIGTPKTMWNFAKAQAQKQMNAPPKTMVTKRRAKGKGSGKRVSTPRSTSKFLNSNSNNTSNSEINLGLLPEEEEVIQSMSVTNVRRFFQNHPRSAYGRTRHQKPKSKKKTRRNNRK